MIHQLTRLVYLCRWITHLVLKDHHRLIMRVRFLQKHFSVPSVLQNRSNPVNFAHEFQDKHIVFQSKRSYFGSSTGFTGLAWYCLMMSLMLWLGCKCSEFETVDLTTSVGASLLVRALEMYRHWWVTFIK